MHTLNEVKRAIESLLSTDRAHLVDWMRQRGYMTDYVSEAAPIYGGLSDEDCMTVEEYLEYEQTSATRHEYVAGHLYAMSGATKHHNEIAFGLAVALRQHLRGRPCKVFMSEIKVHMLPALGDTFYYPDVIVACDEKGKQKDTDPYIAHQARLVIEVLSPSTERIDRNEKLMNYRSLPMLEEYVLVAQKKCEVTIHRRAEEWKPTVARGAAAIAELRSVGLSVPLAEIYEGVLDPDASLERSAGWKEPRA